MKNYQESEKQSVKSINISEKSVSGIIPAINEAFHLINRQYRRLGRLIDNEISVKNYHKIGFGALVFLSAISGYYLVGSNINFVIEERAVKGTAQKVWSLEEMEQFQFDSKSLRSKNGIVELVELDQVDNDLSDTGFISANGDNVSWVEKSNLLTLNQGKSGSYESRVFTVDKSVEWTSLHLETSSDSKVLSENLLVQLSFEEDDIENSGSLEGKNLLLESYSDKGGKSLMFDKNPETTLALKDFVQFPTDQLTTAFWIKTEGQNQGIVSYATPSEDNEWLLYRPQSLSIYRGSSISNTQINIADGKWHHLVVTWSSDTGELKVYVDGVMKYEALQTPGKKIVSGGSLILGGDQDAYGGEIMKDDALEGLMDDFMLWSKSLTAEEVNQIFSSYVSSVKYQVKGCDNNCDNSDFVGPDGTGQTYYSSDESNLKNYINSQKFQYKLYFDSEREGFYTNVYSVLVGPAHYGSKSGVLTSNSGLEYEVLTGFNHQTTNQQNGDVYYQLSPDGSNWYFWNGVDWKIATDNDYTEARQLNDHIYDYSERFGAGLLYFKAIFISNTGENFGLDSIQIDYSPPKGARVAGATDNKEASSLTNIVESDFKIESYDYYEIDDALLIKGNVSEIQKVVLYGPDGEVMYTDRVQGKWEITLSEISERLGTGHIAVRLVAENATGESTAYENLAIEVPPEIPVTLVIGLILLSLLVTMFLIFVILRDRNLTKPGVNKEIPNIVPKLAPVVLSDHLEDKGPVEIPPYATENRVAKLEDTTENTHVEKPSYTLDDFVKSIMESKESRSSEKPIVAQTPTQNPQDNSKPEHASSIGRKGRILKMKRTHKDIVKLKVVHTEEESIFSQVRSLGAYPILENVYQVSKSVEQFELVPEEKHSIQEDLKVNEKEDPVAKKNPDPKIEETIVIKVFPFTPGSRKIF